MNYWRHLCATPKQLTGKSCVNKYHEKSYGKCLHTYIPKALFTDIIYSTTCSGVEVTK